MNAWSMAQQRLFLKQCMTPRIGFHFHMTKVIVALALMVCSTSVWAGSTSYDLQYLTSGGGVASRPLTVGDYLYIGTGSTLNTWNLAGPLPRIPTRTELFPQPDSITGLVADESGSVLYVATLAYTPAPDISIRGGGIDVYSLENPANPGLIRRIPIDTAAFGYASTPHLIARKDSALYIVDQYGAVQVFDISNPADPQYVDATSYPGNFFSYLNLATSATVRDNQLILTGFTPQAGDTWISALIYDITDPFAPVVAGFRPLDGTGFGPAAAESNSVVVTQDGYALMFGFRLGIFDLRDPEDIHLLYGVTEYPRPGVTGASAVVRGHLAYIATQPLCTFGNCGNGGVLGTDVWDISNPQAPSLVATMPIDLSPTSANQAAGHAARPHLCQRQ